MRIQREKAIRMMSSSSWDLKKVLKKRASAIQSNPSLQIFHDSALSQSDVGNPHTL